MSQGQIIKMTNTRGQELFIEYIIFVLSQFILYRYRGILYRYQNALIINKDCHLEHIVVDQLTVLIIELNNESDFK